MSILNNLERLHTTLMGLERIKRNLNLETDDVLLWCRKFILEATIFSRTGKNWYVSKDDVTLTINAHSLTIITAHKRKNNDNKNKTL